MNNKERFSKLIAGAFFFLIRKLTNHNIFKVFEIKSVGKLVIIVIKP